MFSPVFLDSIPKCSIPEKEILFEIRVEHESDIVLSRRLTGQAAMLLSSGSYQQSSIGAAVSEVLRVLFEGGCPCSVSWYLDPSGEGQSLCIGVVSQDICSCRPGHRAVSPASIREDPGLELARRLVDGLDLEEFGKGVRVTLVKYLSRRFAPDEIELIRERLRNRKPENLIEELQVQNQSLIRAVESLRNRYQELLQLHLCLKESNSTLLENNQNLKDSAVRDPLTGLLNRLRFGEIFHDRARRATEMGEPFSLIFFDVDNFKEINDLCGHSAGDRVLVTLADMVTTRLRKGDFFFRWGGEEFLIVPAHCDLEGAIRLAMELRESIEKQYFEEMDVTCSFGVTSYHPEDDDPARIVDRADGAMYRAKKKGKNRVEVVA